MLRKIYAIRDQKVAAYEQPWFARSHGEAERSFEHHVKQPGGPYNQFPQDFDLYYLGDHDDASGVITALETPQFITKAIDIKDR